MTASLHWPIAGVRRIPSTVYTDPSIYQLEQERIFCGRSWNYVGLAAEVPKPGDFLQTYVGEVPIVLVRDRENQLRAFVNRCTHRGSQFCIKSNGNTKLFTCPYHHWSFNLEGKLVGIPYRRGIKGKGGMSQCFNAENHGLEQLKVTERHGVIFASYAQDIEPLDDYLGSPILTYFDRVCDGRALRVIGTMRHQVHANWKLQIENLKDPFHAALLHAFFVNFGIWRADQATSVKIDALGRNSVLVSTASFKKATKEIGVVNDSESRNLSLEDTRLIEHEPEFEHGTGAVLTIWPNLIILQQLNCLAMRHVRPVGPDTCIKTWTFFGYQTDTPALQQKRLMQLNLLGPSGLVTIDDNEVLALAQAGFTGSPAATAVLEAGDEDGDTDYMITESAIRGFYRYYQSIMGAIP